MTSPRRTFALLGLVVVAASAANVGVSSIAASWDATAERSATLSRSTREVLAALDRRIEITAFFPRDAVGRVEASTLMSRYRKASRRVSYKILDPSLVPGEAQRLGVDTIGSAAVQDVRDPSRVEIAPFTIEIDLSSAIARLVRDASGTVCFATGHGERERADPSPGGLSRAAALLEDNGYATEDIDLLIQALVPAACDAVVVAAPSSAIGAAALDALRGYLASSGKAFLLGDTGAADLTPVSREWGIRFVPGVLVEADPGSHLPEDVTAPIVRRYSEASPAVRGLGPTFFAGAVGVEADAPDDPGLSVAEIAHTSPLSYLDREDLGSFDPDVDVQGPVALGAAADSSEVRAPGTEEAEVLRTRILAWGDVDFATNHFLGDAANARLWVQGVDWLTQPEALVTAVPSFPKLRELELTEARSRYLLLLTAGVVPGLFAIAGGFVWVIRRGR